LIVYLTPAKEMTSKQFYNSSSENIRALRKEHNDVYRALDWKRLAKYENVEQTKLRSKTEQVRVFIDYFDYLPPQGSLAWKRSRDASDNLPPIIGGSEIHKIAKGSASDKKELYKTKLGLSSFSGNKYTRWGNLFEAMIQLYCDVIYKTKTYETGSIPGLRDGSGNVIQSYSPDGVNVIDDEITLMEFKCPPSRVPDGKVPPQYYSQPRTGACTIDIVEKCLFVDAAFRRCTYDDFDYGDVYNKDRYLHPNDKPGMFSGPLSLGMIGIYDTSQPFSQDDSSDGDDDDDELGSLGLSSSEGTFDYDPTEDMERLSLRVQPPAVSETPEISEKEREKEKEREREKEREKEEDLEELVVPWKHITSDDYENISQALKQYSNLNHAFLMRVIWEYLQDNYYIRGYYANHIWDVEKVYKRVKGVSYIDIDMIINITNMCISLRAPDMRQSAGLDFGEPQNNGTFLEVLERSINERFAVKGYKIYYPTSICMPSWHPLELKDWMDRQLFQFVSTCRTINAKPVGFIPWKLMKVSLIPIDKEPDFLSSIEQKVRDAVAEIHAIRLATKDPEERRRLVEEKCPVRSRLRASNTISAPAPKQVSESDPEPEPEKIDNDEKIMLPQHVLDDMNDL
jgi:hypothetical protein